MTLLAALLGATFISVSANDASVLLAKHTQYVGWQAGDPILRGWNASGTRTNGHANDTFAEKRRGIAFRDTLTAAAGRVSIQTGFTGTVLWESDPNGFLVKQSGTPAQIAYDVNLLRAETLASVPNVSVTGSGQVRGTAVQILTAKPAVAPPMDIYEDPTTGAFLQAIVDPNGPARTVVSIDAYADVVSGKKAVSQWTVGTTQYTLTSISAANVTDAELNAPQPTATWTFGDQGIPVDLFDLSAGSQRYQPRVNLTVNGITGVFVLDTGTQSIVLFGDFAGRAGVTAIDGADFSPFAGNPRYLGYGLVQTLTAGNSTLHNVMIERIADPNNRIAGLLGYDFYAGIIAEVDLSSRHMQIYNPATTQPTVPPEGHAFPIDLTSHRPVIGMRLSGKAYGFPYFSTGEPYFMLLSQRLRESGAVSASDMSTEHFNPTAGSRGFFGTMIESDPVQLGYSDYTGAYGVGNCVLLNEALIGPYRYQSPPLCFVGSGVFGEDGGAIGNDFLRHFDWTIDYPDATFVLTPNNLP
jgi:hypothetical protein